MSQGIYSCIMAGTVALTAVSGNFCDFKTVKEAEAFGWKPRKNCTMSLDKGPAGGGAVVVTAEKGAKKYRGITLYKKFPLSKATAKDYVSVKIWQNYGSGTYLLFTTKKGAVHLSTRLPRKKWTTVKFNLDYNKWDKSKKIKTATWTDAVSLAFYDPTFKKPGTFMKIADLQISIGGKKYTP